MAKAKFDIKTIQTTVQTEAQRTLHASVGAADLALEAVKEYVAATQKRFDGYQKDAQKQLAKAQKSVKGFEFQPQAVRSQVTKDAKARRDAVEKRVAELQAEAQKFVTGNVETAADTYDELVKRGETVVKRLRKQSARTVAPADVKVVNKTASKNATATKAPARKSTATKAPAKRTPAAKKTAKQTVSTAR